MYIVMKFWNILWKVIKYFNRCLGSIGQHWESHSNFYNNPCDVTIPSTYCFLHCEYFLLFSLVFHPTGCTRKWIHKMPQHFEIYRKYSFSAWCSQQYTAHTFPMNSGSTPCVVTSTLTQFSESLTHTSLSSVQSVTGNSKIHTPVSPSQK
jgi:hypothetical protein